ncbi:MAG: thioredoxin family protein [Arcobacteraceae bacterium]|nr:thioredoxin family protein [Arcobacteraceae bacterium]
MNIEELNNKIKDTPALMVYFSGEHCGVCKVLQPKLTSAFKEKYPLIEQLVLEVEQYPLIAGQFSVFALPTVIIYFDGKEINRKSRNLSVEGLINEIKRPYGLFF